tara:strand:- start:292 stop:768 length:477 start_codon:yes stop_codon:yes gene_type:complete
MPDSENEIGIRFDHSVIGQEIEVGSHYVSEKELVDYAKSLGETNPLYIDPVAASEGPYSRIIATPGYYTAIPLRPSLDPKIHFISASFSYLAGQNIRYFKHIGAGDTIRARSQVTNVYKKTGRSGSLVFIERKTVYTNQEEDIVLTVESSNVRSNNQD